MLPKLHMSAPHFPMTTEMVRMSISIKTEMKECHEYRPYSIYSKSFTLPAHSCEMMQSHRQTPHMHTHPQTIPAHPFRSPSVSVKSTSISYARHVPARKCARARAAQNDNGPGFFSLPRIHLRVRSPPLADNSRELHLIGHDLELGNATHVKKETTEIEPAFWHGMACVRV
ncbi:hypothetical protein DM02DRAFT_193466 [Periconia macrospinosa]|uniref:Uncharacterized protein n=1 Tax=Periconia macrospinosa TaxID=97972 RepID=A0A2V1E156_9PLEO|nr:hypothetical protein DM02DRAFT_193466 [Periconia macrospinosa]